MRLAGFTFAAALLACIGLWIWSAPDSKAKSLAESFQVGMRQTNLLYAASTNGFDVIEVKHGTATYIRGEKRGQTYRPNPRLFPYGTQIEDVCQGETCQFFAAERIDRPFGAASKFKHHYNIGWVSRDGILQAVGQSNRLRFYPLK